MKIIYATLHTKTQPSACTTALSSSSISLAPSERMQRDLRVLVPTSTDWAHPGSWHGPNLSSPPGTPVDVIDGNWDTQGGTKLSLGGCGAKQGGAEEIQFGARWTGMVRYHLPNPFCCSEEIHGENTRMSKLRVQPWRGGKMCESLRVSKYGN